MPNAIEQWDSCIICNEYTSVTRHYGALMCNKDEKLCDRIRIKNELKGEDLTNEEILTAAATRRQEIKEKGTWSRNDVKYRSNIRIGILK